MLLTELDTFSFDNIFEMLSDLLDSTFMVPSAILNIFSYLPPLLLLMFIITIMFSILGGIISVILRII